MLDHHLQRAIVYELAFMERARFSELKPDGLDNKLFSYHLKKVLLSGLIIKSDDGSYSLTPEGRRFSTGVNEKNQSLIVERAHSVLYLVIRRKLDSAWLLYERKTHPMLGYKGFIHANPTSDKSVEQNAQDQVIARTGLRGTFTPLGGGYFTSIKDGVTESFTNFTLLYCEDAEGDLVQNDNKAVYFWANDLEQIEQLFPSTFILRDKYLAKQAFFIQKTFQL